MFHKWLTLHDERELESTVDEGTAITVYFPASETVEKSHVSPIRRNEPIRSPLDHRPVLLLVDDNLALLDVAATMLSHAGYNVFTAEGGSSAVEIYQKEWKRIEAVVLDMTMPDMSGEEVYSHLIQINPTVKTILASGFHESEAMGKFSIQSKVDFIQKPYRPAQLIERVRRILGVEETVIPVSKMG
jgi:response regulator RpfG family c-di-GMP phosphodiesterase